MSKLVVLGAGESGVGAAILGKRRGYEVFVSDSSHVKDVYKQMLEAEGIRFEEGGHTAGSILAADEVVKSPGIPDDAPLIVSLRQKGIPVISEIEFAGRYSHAKMICITGSNGKTTTTSLIYHILSTAGYDVGLAGNIGSSLARQVVEGDHEWFVIELSSFQLDGMYDFRADIAVILNITPDHLDRYGYDMQRYVDAKFRILQNQHPDDAFIFWNDDPIIRKNIEMKRDNIKSKFYPFSDNPDESGLAAYLKDGRLSFTEPSAFNMEQEELALTGRHNLYDSMAAGIAANVAGIKKENIRRALSDFVGVPHRLEKVARVAGVDYINDSKATNVNSCWYALQSVRTPVVLILGGKDKGNDYSEIEQLVVQKVHGLVLLGVDNAKLHSFFDGKVPVIADAHSMHEAVTLSASMASPGDTVLLSPCCASFDLFKSYEDRGDQFKAEVMALAGQK